MEITTYLSERRRRVEDGLARFMLAADGPFREHIESMRYSLFVGGKRLRPILCLAGAEAVDEAEAVARRVLPVACALECIHTYSLIHDDLPAMDDDDLRRGKPTNHTVFGEAAAILAGDGLLTFAFELLGGEATATIDAATRVRVIAAIARAAGTSKPATGRWRMACWNCSNSIWLLPDNPITTRCAGTNCNTASSTANCSWRLSAAASPVVVHTMIPATCFASRWLTRRRRPIKSMAPSWNGVTTGTQIP